MKNETRILYVEDVPADVVIVNHELRKAGMAFCSGRVDTKEAFLDELQHHPPDLILSIDHEGLVQEWNPAAEKIFGYESGANAYVVKLVTFPEFRATLQHLKTFWMRLNELSSGDPNRIGSGTPQFAPAA